MMNTSLSVPFLSDDEVASLCDGLVASGAQLRYLERMGLLVQRKPNGKVLLLRSELERVLGADRFRHGAQNPALAQPNRAALMQVIESSKRGTQTQRR
jgi:hypothetical protein